MRRLLWLIPFLLGFMAGQARGAPAPPQVVITSPAEGVSTDRIVQVTGTVSDPSISSATLLYNGTSFPMRVRDGGFSRNLVMAPGQNFIEVYARNASGVGKDSVSLLSKVPRSDVQVTLWWDADASDLDLWVVDPTGEKCWYQDRATPIGGSLDVDVTDGFGPETFSVAHAVPGAYQVQAHFYGDRRQDRRPIRVFARVVLFEGTDREYRKDYSLWLTRPGEVLNVTSFNVFAF